MSSSMKKGGLFGQVLIIFASNLMVFILFSSAGGVFTLILPV